MLSLLGKRACCELIGLLDQVYGKCSVERPCMGEGINIYREESHRCTQFCNPPSRKFRTQP